MRHEWSRRKNWRAQKYIRRSMNSWGKRATFHLVAGQTRAAINSDKLRADDRAIMLPNCEQTRNLEF